MLNLSCQNLKIRMKLSWRRLLISNFNYNQRTKKNAVKWKSGHLRGLPVLFNHKRILLFQPQTLNQQWHRKTCNISSSIENENQFLSIVQNLFIYLFIYLFINNWKSLSKKKKKEQHKSIKT